MSDLKIVVHPDVYAQWRAAGIDLTDVLAYEQYVGPSSIMGGGYSWVMADGVLTLIKGAP